MFKLSYYEFRFWIAIGKPLPPTPPAPLWAPSKQIFGCEGPRRRRLIESSSTRVITIYALTTACRCVHSMITAKGGHVFQQILPRQRGKKGTLKKLVMAQRCQNPPQESQDSVVRVERCQQICCKILVMHGPGFNPGHQLFWHLAVQCPFSVFLDG